VAGGTSRIGFVPPATGDWVLFLKRRPS
jgi:hypothetical protein